MERLSLGLASSTWKVGITKSLPTHSCAKTKGDGIYRKRLCCSQSIAATKMNGHCPVEHRIPEHDRYRDGFKYAGTDVTCCRLSRSLEDNEKQVINL